MSKLLNLSITLALLIAFSFAASPSQEHQIERSKRQTNFNDFSQWPRDERQGVGLPARISFPNSFGDSSFRGVSGELIFSSSGPRQSIPRRQQQRQQQQQQQRRPPSPNSSNGNENTTTDQPRVVYINGRPTIISAPVFTRTTRTPRYQNCIDTCPTTPEYNPVCGSDKQVYFNEQKFNCARRCGADIQIVRRGPCEDKMLLKTIEN